ncbi:MAG: proline reductase-associated electron transfer protein PrdC [Lactococcus lactis]|uniref:proline reductase-associated electron transfer protein PrdC n=1 Tax=Tetragenococcus halophilus TaxID=51669 RepID=UPI001F2112CA|nr:proline reductase-associated electron transfer protein PrdC [Tetragenococcus halophilus]MDN6139613.1 proline reductase-associated electron transfer protein PrdC [Tetragenococcus koreensis]MDN6167487.1 proline reductase-associated electron transfer protein PrdC [Lactococcus lactis]MDN6193828.1 proline reductase-associated electron transfer protein PrdC [Alkalibacterium sp.]MDN6611638.1 proline reductase-associated electron transfer protein PrdC [Staphylococcus equorum]MCF1675823.1 proline re
MLRLDLKQGIGQVGTSCVNEGDKVERGQILTEIDLSKLGVPLHAPLNGQITKVTGQTIELEPSDLDDDFVPIQTAKSISETVRNAGIVGMGGAGFPTYFKLQTDLSQGGYVLCNAAECEPILQHNIDQINANPQKLVRGLKLAMKATGAPKGIIGVKLKNKETVKALTQVVSDDPDIRVFPLKNMYPAGEERALIRDSLNVLLDTDELPQVADTVVINSETMMAIADAVDDHKPLLDKHLTVAGKLNNISQGETQSLSLAVGTQIKDILKKFGGISEQSGEIILGGPYTGVRTHPKESISKTSGGVIVTQPFEKVTKKLGLIQCACGASESRMRELADSYQAEVVDRQVCKNAVEVQPGVYKCKNPGVCPGQAEKVLALRKAGAEEVLIGHCTDCTNTVMEVAPKLNMTIHHVTDHALKTQGMNLIRRMEP